MSVKVKDVLDALQQMQKSLECSICLELLKDPHSTKCNHQFCGQCIRQVLEKSSKKSKNKWYCPLCKTPVSKRSLTPNPKLNEIVAAVRNLREAVQADTGLPTGSPPSLLLKGPNTDVNSSVVSFSVPQPTPQKNATAGHKGRRKASRDQFTVYIDKTENFGHALESQPPQIVSNVNIRSSLRPLPVTQTQTKAKKSAKTETTRKTRNSRRIQEQKSLPEDTDLWRNSNDDLLHLIDTMTFKPVPTEGSSKDFILDPKTEEKLTPSDNFSPATITLRTLKEDASEKDDCKLNPSKQKEKPVCLTTIAEADSSISINPCSSTGLFGDKNLVNCENTANSKENIVAVTSSKIADCTLSCIPQSSSLDTMQSVSILQSLEVQPPDSAGDFFNESDVEDNQQNDVTCQGDETDELVANEKCDVENREEMYDETRGNAFGENPIHDDDEANFKRVNKENKQILGSIAFTETYEKVRDVVPNSIPAEIPDIENYCIEGNSLSSTVICDSAIQEKPAGNYEERETHDKRLSQPSDTILPPENVKTSPEQSLDFEGLVSLFDEPSYSTSQDAMHREETAQNSTRLDKAAEHLQQAHTLHKETNLGQSLEAEQQVETVNNISSSSTPTGKKTSPRQKGRGLANLPDSEDSDDSSDLCERVKQRQRRGTSKVLLTESPTTSLTTESKSKKRTVDSMTSFKTRDESNLEGSAKKKFKTSEVPSPSQFSSEKPNTARKQTPRNSEAPSKQKQTEELVATDCDERSQSHQSEMVNYSCATDKSIDSNEMIPASVSSSSSENSKSAVIDPMDVYADLTREEKKEVASKRKESLKFHKIKERGIFVEDYSLDLKTAEGRSQDERQHFSAPQVKNAVDQDDSTQGFTPSPKLSFLSQNLKDSTGGQSLINELKTSHLAESLPFDPSQKASLSATEQRSQLYEENFVDQERIITGQDLTSYDEDTNFQIKTLITPQCTSGINSLKGKETGDTKNDARVKGEYSSQLAENRSKTCKPLSQEGCTSSGTPTQCSLEADDFTPCLFRNNSCETPAKIVSQKRTKRVETPLQEGIEEHNGGMNDAEIEEIGVLDDSETSGVTGLLSGSQKGASLTTCSDGTQSFGTSQSISVLHDLDVPSQGQQEDTARRDDPSEPAIHAEHSNKETESNKAWAEPFPKKPRSKQQPESQGMELNLSNCHSKKKTNGSELTESEIIPPTPPVKTVTKHVFDVHAQSPLKLTSPKRNVQTNETSKATCHSKSLTVKRKRSIRSPRCSNSPKLQNNDDGTAMHVSSSFSRGSEVNVSVLENHDHSSMNADIKGLSQAMEFEVGTSASSEQQQVNLSQETNTETLVHGSKINANKTPKRLRRLDNMQKQANYSESISPRVLDGPRLSQSEANSKVSNYDNVGREDLRDSPSAEVESVHSSPCSPVKRRLDNMGDSFDWSGTRTVQKRGGYSRVGPVALNNCDNNVEHFRGKEVEDCYVDQLNSPNPSQARDETEDSSEDSLRRSEAKGELADPFVGNIRVRNPCNVVDEEILLTDAEEEDSSGDESLLKPAFLPKESRKSPESHIDNTHDSDDEEEEVTAFSQELIPSENEDDDDDGASYKALDSTGASTSTFLSEAAASTQRMDVLRQDVEAMEKEMEELRAYLATTDENREDEEHTLKGDDINYQEGDLVDDGDIQPSLTPPPPLTPKSIPPMPQLSTPLKNFSRYLEQEGQSSDEGSECEDATISEPVKRTELPRRFGYQGNKSTTERLSPGEKSGKKRPLSPSDDDDDGLRITEVEHRQEETPSPPRSNHSMERSQEKDEDKLIVIDDRDGPESRKGSLLLVKRRKLTHNFAPKKSPVVSLLFTRAGKGLDKPGQSPETRSKGSSPAMEKSSSTIYSRKPGTSISPIRGQSPTKTVSLKDVSRDNLSKKDLSHNGVSRGNASNTSVSQSNVSREKLSRERSHSPDLVLTNVKKVTSKKSLDNKREDRTIDRQLSFVATRLNRQQLAEARTLAETYGGKLASEFNSKTSHVIMTTDENMQVTRHSYTMKYLLGLALGKWIVSHRWIAACNQAKSLVSEVDYEVKGDAGLGQASIPRVARKAGSNKEALLFQDYEVLCLGEFSAAVTKEQLSQLLRFCGASVFIDAESMKRTEKGRQRVVTIDKETRDNAKELKAICRQLNKKPVSLEWVTDSIANYKVQDLKDYIVEL